MRMNILSLMCQSFFYDNSEIILAKRKYYFKLRLSKIELPFDFKLPLKDFIFKEGFLCEIVQKIGETTYISSNQFRSVSSFHLQFYTLNESRVEITLIPVELN